MSHDSQVVAESRSHFAVKLGVSVVLTLGATWFLAPQVQLAAMAFGNIVFLVVPYSTIWFCVVSLQPPNNPVPIAIDYAQFLIYGLVLGQGWARGIFRKAALWVAITHVLAVVLAMIVWPHTGLVWPL